MSHDIPSISELEAIQLLNKHYAEVVTSKKDGIASGLDITQTTNPITGVIRRTLYKILDDMDETFLERLLKMAFTRVGTFTAGATLTDMRQVLIWEISKGGDGHEYGWTGIFPKVVAAGETPTTSGGIGAGAWVDRSDVMFRDELAGVDGDSFVGDATYAQIRAYTGDKKSIRCGGRTSLYSGDGAHGNFYRDDLDTTSADNDGTVLIDSLGRRWKRKYSGAVNVKWFGAIGDGITNDTLSIQNSINTSTVVYIPPGTYFVNDVVISKNIKIYGAGVNQTSLRYSGTKTCLRLATNNNPEISDLTVINNNILPLFSRTAVGIDVFGDVASGSYIQQTISNVRIEGFAIGIQVAGSWNSRFYGLTLKRNDISFKLLNDTNDSTWFYGCSSNNSIGKHIVGVQGSGASSGAAFTNCEFEDAHRYPYVDMTGNSTLTFINCYAYENNKDDGNGQYYAIKLQGGKFLVNGGGFNCNEKEGSRLIYSRKGSFAFSNIVIIGAIINAHTDTTPIVDEDAHTEARDITYIQGTRIKNTGTNIYACVHPSDGSAWKVDGSTLDHYSGTFTPTLSGATLGNGTIDASYSKHGKAVTVQFEFTLGSTSEITGNFNFTLPIASADKGSIAYGVGNLLDNGTENYGCRCLINSGQAVCYIQYLGVSGGLVYAKALGATAPFTWTAGDKINVSITYEVN